MKLSLALLLSAAVASAWFAPNERIDRGYPGDCAAITVGPSVGQTQPIYVALTAGYDVVLQKSTDAGRTWLSQCHVVGRGSYPDVTTDASGNIYVSCSESHHYYCVRSTDSGATWSAPAQIDDIDTICGGSWSRIAVDTAGNLFCAWIDQRLGSEHIWSSVSTDKGTTWSTNVRVDRDSSNAGCCHTDVCVQPGTNHYLVAAKIPELDACLFRSTDMGQTFLPPTRIGDGWVPRIVADRNHVICDYNRGTGDQDITEARTLYTPPDTWGSVYPVTDLGSRYTSFANGGQLALSADGRVHAALMVSDFVADGEYLIYYTYSSDHGVLWADRERVSDDTTADKFNPDIAVDAAGHVYIVWQDWRNGGAQCWFSTNDPAGIAEQPPKPCGKESVPSIVRRLPPGSAAFDATGRRILHPKPGIYFVQEAQAQAQAQAVRKVLLVR